MLFQSIWKRITKHTARSGRVGLLIQSLVMECRRESTKLLKQMNPLTLNRLNFFRSSQTIEANQKVSKQNTKTEIF